MRTRRSSLTSLITGSLAVSLLYLLGREIVGARTALLAATLFALSPLVWYYSIVALTYAVESFCCWWWSGSAGRALDGRRRADGAAGRVDAGDRGWGPPVDAGAAAAAVAVRGGPDRAAGALAWVRRPDGDLSGLAGAAGLAGRRPASSTSTMACRCSASWAARRQCCRRARRACWAIWPRSAAACWSR